QVPVSKVLEFLSSYTAYSTHSFLNRCEQLRRYIEERKGQGELTSWTVVLFSKEAAAETVDFGGVRFGLRERARDGDEPPGQFVTRAVVGLAEESADLTEEEFKDALDQTRSEERRAGKESSDLSSVPGRAWLREARPPDRGMLLL